MYDPVTFHGITSGFKQTIITGWSPDIPFVLPYSQLKVLTAPETNPGDSGAALIDRDGKVTGFSFFRTAINQQPEYSSWIWADSVYKAHNLLY
jgi:S1-C subfamily serine protease